jgi:hypothetical protein
MATILVPVTIEPILTAYETASIITALRYSAQVGREEGYSELAQQDQDLADSLEANLQARYEVLHRCSQG